MEEFMRRLHGVEARVILKHSLFDSQIFYCQELKTINDDTRVGLILKNHEVFMYKQDVNFVEINGNTYTISDGRLTIKVKKL